MAEFTEEQFIALVQRSEAEASTNISAYKTKLALFALLGYFVIFAVVAMLIALVGGTVAIAMFSSTLFLLLIKKKLILVILVAIWTFLKALWVRFEAPTGHELKREDYPELFRELDDLTEKLDSLKIHQVMIDDRLNASVVQNPRFGILGGQRNTLFLGLQLLLALSPEEMRSVLAHEIGHLSGNHSRFSGWIYRIRLTWFRVMHAFESTNSFGAGLMRRFFDWYAPKFSAYSFALARNNEYEADQVAAALTSPEIAASALMNVHAKAPYIEKEFWRSYFEQADTLPAPPALPFERLAEFLKTKPLERATLLELINEELKTETHYADTHPALKDRVKGLVSDVFAPAEFDTSAAEAWLGEHYQELVRHFDEEWQKDNLGGWKQRYEYVRDARNLMEDPASSNPAGLNNETLWRLATVTNEFEGDDAALFLYQVFQAREPASIGAAYHIGRILAAKDDEQALPHLEIALGNPNTIGDAANWGYDLLTRIGKQKEAEAWWEKALARQKEHQLAYAERASITTDDTFKAPEMDREVLDALLQQLAQHKKVGKTWLAEKVLNTGGDPLYVITFKARGFSFSTDKLTQTIAESLDVNAEIFVVCLQGDNRKLAKQIKKAGTRIR